MGDGGEGRGERDDWEVAVMYTEAAIDGGGDRVGGESGGEEDGDVEEEVVLLVGGFGGLDVEVGEEGLDVDPGAGWGRGEGVGDDDDDERV